MNTPEEDPESFPRTNGGRLGKELTTSTLAMLLSALVVLTVVLRIIHAHGQSVTFDEHYEIALAKENVADIVMRGDGFPPLYALALHAWDQWFGSESGRSFSFLLAAIGCLAMYRLAATVAGRRVGLWAAFLLSILPFHMVYTAEIRAYPLLLVFATLGLECWVRAIRNDRWMHWVGFSMFTAMGMHTHYLFGLFPAMTLLISLAYIRNIKPFAAGALILVLTVPLSLIWLPSDFAMQANYEHQVQFGILELAFTYGSYFLGLSLGPSLRELHYVSHRDAIMQVAPFAGAFCMVLFLFVWSARHTFPWRNKEIWNLAVLSTCPIFSGVLCTTLGVGYNLRYALWTLIPIVVLLATMLEHAVYGRLGKLALVILLMLFSLAVYNRSQIDRYQNEDLRSVAAYVRQSGRQSQATPMLVVSGYMVEPLGYYVQGDWPLKAIPMMSPFGERFVEMERIFAELKSETNQFWLVYTREFHQDPDGRLLESIRRAATLQRVEDFAGVTLYLAAFAVD